MQAVDQSRDMIHSQVATMLAPKGVSTLARRRYQKGQLWKDGDRWMGRWREDLLSADGTVSRVRRQEMIAWVKDCPTKRLAQRMLDDRLREINSVAYKPTPTISFAAFSEKWKKEVACYHKPSSQDNENSLIRCHLIPAFGSLALKDITLERIQGFVNQFPLSPKTLRNTIVILMGMWEMAMAWEYVTHNPFPRGINGKILLKMPKSVKPKTYAFTTEEALAIIDRAPAPWKLLFRMAAETGIRSGELAGIRRTDLRGRVVTIGQSVHRQKIQTPKTANAYRSIVISQGLADDLQAYIEATTGAHNPHGLIWTDGKGKPVRMHNSLYRNVLDPILVDLGIREKMDRLGVNGGCYAFRRMNATLMDGLSVPLKTRQARFGHADPQTILRHYSKEVDADNLAAAEQIGALLSPKGAEIVQ